MARKVPLNRVRNIGIAAHIDAGKTTSTERIFFIQESLIKLVRLMKVLQQWTGWSKSKKEVLQLLLLLQHVSGHHPKTNEQLQINIIDTPGHVDFTIEVERSMRVLDGAVAVFCSVGGVQPQSETVWRQANKYGVPRIIYVNKMDRTGANFFNVMNQVRDRLKANPVPLQIPIGSEDQFRGMVDLVKMKAYTYTLDAQAGEMYKIEDIPADLVDTANEYREKLVEAAAESSDELMDKYLGGEELTEEEITSGIKKRCLAMEITPMVCGTSFKNKGIQPLLDAVAMYLPAPTEVADIKGETQDGEAVIVPSTDKGEVAALAFKIMTDPFVGQLTFTRIYRGILESGTYVLNSTKMKKRESEDYLKCMQTQEKRLKNFMLEKLVQLLVLKIQLQVIL